MQYVHYNFVHLLCLCVLPLIGPMALAEEKRPRPTARDTPYR